MTGLAEGLRAWDGKSTEALLEIHNRYKDESHFVARLLALATVPGCGRAATWLLKRHLQDGGSAIEDETRKLLSLLRSEAEHWEVTLHCLQCLPHLSLPRGSAATLRSDIDRLIEHDRPFVRAWAYGGALTLARQDPDLGESAERLCRAAWITEPASVRARLRQMGYSGGGKEKPPGQ